MSKIKPEKNIQQVVTNIIDYALIFGTILGVAAFFLGLKNYQPNSLTYSYYIEASIIIVYIITILFRHKIEVKFKTLVVIAGILTIIFSDIVKLGVYSENLIFLILIPLFAYLSFNLKKAIIIFILSLIYVLALAYLYYNNFFGEHLDFNVRGERFSPWIIILITLTIVAFINVTVIQQFYKTFNEFINDLKNKNKDIAEREKNYQDIFNASADAIFIHDMDARILDVNDAMLQTYGYTKEEIPFISMKDMSSGEKGFDEESAIKKIKAARETGKEVFDWRAKKKSGEIIWVRVTLRKTKIIEKDRILAFVEDINEQKENEITLKHYQDHLETLVEERTIKLEKAYSEVVKSNESLDTKTKELEETLERLQTAQNQLMHSEKMASLGVLSAGIAHEINNPLNFIMGGLAAFESYLEENNIEKNHDLDSIMEAMNEGVDRASDIVSSLRHFSRQGEDKIEVCNLNTIIDNCLVILKNTLKNKVKISRIFTTTPPIIKGNDGRLHQVILNLIINAEQAIEKDGEITIATMIENEKVKVIISDTGSGIAKENMERIMDPFFTTKEAGMGTGLGLSICYNIVNEHQGTLSFNSEVGKGTTVTLVFPGYNTD